MKTKSQEVAADIAALLKARNPLIWVVTREEARVEQYLIQAAKSVRLVPRTWDIGSGVCDENGVALPDIGGSDPEDTLKAIDGRADEGDERGLWIMRDMPVWLAGPSGAKTARILRNLARKLPSTSLDTAQAIVVLSPSGDVPPELAGHATVIEWPMPDRAEIATILDEAIARLPEELRETAAPNGQRDAAIDAAVGLSGEEAASCYAKSLVQLRRIDPVAVAKEKKRVITRERVLEWHDALPGGLESVGGLDQLKSWLVARRSAYSPAARAFGLPSPKGILLVGPPGTGKTLTAKATATALGVPLLRLDLGALKSKFVGESEGNLRKALKVVEAIGRCVLWIDEVDKALQGATSGSADGGVSSDALGAVLSWMQERTSEAFIVATSNSIDLPPEFMRKGRLDEIWLVDLPTATERGAVLRAALRSYGRGDVALDVALITTECDGFTGSEIAAIVPDALFTAFNDGAREITTDDLVQAAKKVVPLSVTAKDKIAAMREWAKGKARPATSAETTDRSRRTGRDLDI